MMMEFNFLLFAVGCTFAGVICVIILMSLRSAFREIGEGECIVWQIFCGIGALIGLLVALTQRDSYFETVEKEDVVEIFAAGISNGSEGNAFVLRDRDFYRYYVGDSISGFNLLKCDASRATIKYTDKKPYIKTIYDESVKFPGDIRIVRYELYVPYGSVIQDYKFDL